jgi:hypothetical protein
MGESLATVQKFDVPLEQATTSSLEALKAYSLGWKTGLEKGTAAALPYYQLAIELDPNFANGLQGSGQRLQGSQRAWAGERILRQSVSIADTRQRTGKAGDPCHVLHGCDGRIG